MSSVVASHNPFISGFLPPKGETPHERSLREREEARAKAVSDAIDKEIEQDRVAFVRYRKATKVLLLGQSESGKSTMIKNFQLMYAYDAWVRERSLWKTVIYLNLVRSVATVLDIMNKAMKEHQRSLSPSLSLDGRKLSNDSTPGLALHFSEKHRLLQLRLKPLTTIQGDLEDYLCSVLEPVQVGTALHTTFPSPDAESPGGSRRHMRFSASGNSSWRTRFSSEKPKGPTGRRVIRDLNDIIEVLYCCGSDIQQLWADDAVQRVIKGAKSPFDLSELEDVDRFLKRDYVPSDEDVVKAKFQTVGVQEYHFSIPTPDGANDDWILYDVGGLRTSRHAWCSYFDNINSIIFLVPVDSFDRFLVEDASVNRLEDSLLIWRHVCDSKLLANIQLILFFNKADLLKEKLESGVRFGKYVPNYGDRPNDVSSVIPFLAQRFKGILRSSGSERAFNWHIISAVDVRVVSKILLTVRDGIIRETLQHSTLL